MVWTCFAEDLCGAEYVSEYQGSSLRCRQNWRGGNESGDLDAFIDIVRNLKRALRKDFHL